MTNFKYPVCKHTFSTRSGYSQHANICIQVVSSSNENNDDNITMDINETMLESEKSFNSIEVY